MRRITAPYLMAAFLTHYPDISKYLSDEKYLRIVFRGYMDMPLDLEMPKTFNEKMQWLKLHDRDPRYVQMVDKIEAKEYVRNLIGDEYIIPTLGVYDHFEEIDFTNLPDKFVIKCSHDSGGLVICRGKDDFDTQRAGRIINKSLKNNFYWRNREWPYKDVPPRILIEELLEDKQTGKLTDYKFFCFQGNPEFLYVSRGLEDHATAEVSFYDLEGNEMEMHRTDYRQCHGASFPGNITQMKEIAQKIALDVGNQFVRIDLYSVDSRIYFSEITFSPGGGMIPFEPKSADLELGKRISLSGK